MMIHWWKIASVLACLSFCSSLSASENRLQATVVVEELLGSDSLSEIQANSDILSECTVDASDVKKLINAAIETNSDSRRNLLWHSIRFTHSQLGRDFLKESIASAPIPMRIEWIQSLRNPAPFDIPILVAVYESAEKGSASDEATLRDFFARFALSSWRDSCVTRWHSTKNSDLYRQVSDRRQADADAAQLRILTYLITNGHDIETRIAAYQYKGHSWFKGFEPENRSRLATQLLAATEAPKDRARLISILRNQIKPTWYLSGPESTEVKLAAIEAIGESVADGWRGTAGYDVLRQAYQDLLLVAQDEDHPELSRAASKMIRTLESRYGEKAVRQ